MSSIKHIWHQDDREEGLTLARRKALMTLATVTALCDIADESLSRVRQEPVFYKRALEPLSTAIGHARTLLDAYDYYLARCQEGGITLDQAEAAWQVHSSAAFEAEMIEAESYGPNAMHMIDAQILVHLGLPPHAAEVQVEDAGDAD
jgi:hypothetical protein